MDNNKITRRDLLATTAKVAGTAAAMGSIVSTLEGCLSSSGLGSTGKPTLEAYQALAESVGRNAEEAFTKSPVISGVLSEANSGEFSGLYGLGLVGQATNEAVNSYAKDSWTPVEQIYVTQIGDVFQIQVPSFDRFVAGKGSPTGNGYVVNAKLIFPRKISAGMRGKESSPEFQANHLLEGHILEAQFYTLKGERFLKLVHTSALAGARGVIDLVTGEKSISSPTAEQGVQVQEYSGRWLNGLADPSSILNFYDAKAGLRGKSVEDLLGLDTF